MRRLRHLRLAVRALLAGGEACRPVFYDHSKNNSKIWHDLARCGTPMHLRAYRKRLREAEEEAEAAEDPGRR